MLTNALNLLNPGANINPKLFSNQNTIDENTPTGFFDAGYINVSFLVNNEFILELFVWNIVTFSLLSLMLTFKI